MHSTALVVEEQHEDFFATWFLCLGYVVLFHTRFVFTHYKKHQLHDTPG